MSTESIEINESSLDNANAADRAQVTEAIAVVEVTEVTETVDVIETEDAITTFETVETVTTIKTEDVIQVIDTVETVTTIETEDVIEVTETVETVEVLQTEDVIEVTETVETVEVLQTEDGIEIIETVEVTESVAVIESVQASNSDPSGARPTPAMMAASVRPTAPVVVPVAEAVSDSVRFGRIDDDGTVYLLADGSETPVGQWAAGTPEEGLAFFARKFDDVSAEIDLAIQRLSDGKASPESPAAAIARAEEALAAMIGDVEALRTKITRINELVEERRKVIAEERAQARAAALAAREAIVNESEALANSNQWKSTGDRFKALLEDWKVAPRADRASEQALWKRFSHARSQFDKARRQHFAKLDAERDEAKRVKNDLVARAQELATSTDWGPTAGEYGGGGDRSIRPQGR